MIVDTLVKVEKKLLIKAHSLQLYKRISVGEIMTL